MLYRLSGIENESEDDDENKEQDAALPQFDARPNESLFGEWQSPFNLSEFQPNQFFPNWDNSSSTTTNNEEPSELPSNGHENGIIPNLNCYCFWPNDFCKLTCFIK